ncbi:MAG: hypothetical protein EP338_14075 [Bacteroidetes bacterium]|nr:MAG: hypothetical protein EP338_14075 [Bacteroidota bacterium]
MKTSLLASIFSLLSGLFLAQETEHIQLGKKKEAHEIFPSIAGHFKDEIPIEKLGDLEGIRASQGWEVLSFKIGYPKGSGYRSLQIKGKQVPDSVVVDIRKSCLNEQVFFTEIKALSPKGKEHILYPMSLIPVLYEE